MPLIYYVSAWRLTHDVEQAIVIVSGGGPDHTALGFTYWRNPGPFVQYLNVPGALGQFLGFWTTFNNAVYSYS